MSWRLLAAVDRVPRSGTVGAAAAAAGTVGCVAMVVGAGIVVGGAGFFEAGPASAAGVTILGPSEMITGAAVGGGTSATRAAVCGAPPLPLVSSSLTLTSRVVTFPA